MKPQIKRPHDPMALAKFVGDIATGQVVDERQISTGEALDALKNHIVTRSRWMLKAQSLMQMVNEPEIDQAKLREMGEEHILTMPEL